MRKQPRILKDIAQMPLVRGQVQAAGAVKHGFPPKRDLPLIGAQQPCHSIDNAGFARTGPAKQNRQPGGHGKIDLQLKARQPMGKAHRQAHVPCTRFAARRASHSEASKAPIATITDTTTSRSAAGSPPGACKNA